VIERARHRQVFLDELRAETQERHHRREAERGVEIGAAHAHTGGREHVAATIGALAVPRADTDDGKVARAAANVGDERQLLALYRLFVMVGSRDGLYTTRRRKARPLAMASAPAPAHLPCRRRRQAHRPAVHDG
jgi:hypothetical protein